MEFIEPKPVEKDPGEKKKKIIIGVASGVLALGALATGMTLLVNNIFLDLDHIEFYTYRHRIEEGLANEVEIVSINDGVTLPKKLRLPNKLSGYPVTKIGDKCFNGCSNSLKINYENHWTKSCKTRTNNIFIIFQWIHIVYLLFQNT